MKIKKIYQGELPENKILNAQSTSQTDTYSCDYINKKVEKSYIQCGLTQNIQVKSGTPQHVCFDNNDIRGNLFFYDSTNNEIVINENVSSGKMKLSLKSVITGDTSGAVPLIAYNVLLNGGEKFIANAELPTSSSRTSISHDAIMSYNAGDRFKLVVTASANSFIFLGTFYRTVLILEEI